MHLVHSSPKESYINLSISPGAPGSLTLTDGLDDSVNDPVWLTVTLGHEEKSMKKM